MNGNNLLNGVTFLDLKQAFDTMDHASYWESLNSVWSVLNLLAGSGPIYRKCLREDTSKWAPEDTYFHDTDLFRFDRLLPTLTCVAGVERDRG